MDRITWTNEKRKISELTHAEYNPRQLTEKQAKDLDASLERFNLADPIIINADNKIIGGHQRINILKRRGAVEVDVRVPSRQLTEHEEKELNLRLNKNLGEWDFDLLADFDQEMLLDVGFDSAELDKMFQLEPDAKDDEVPEPPEAPISKTGDIWILGRHRVMCGDSTKIDDVEKLMDGKKADMVFTDPPYGNGSSEKYGRGQLGVRTILNDDTFQCVEDFINLQISDVYVFFLQWRTFKEAIKVLEQNELQLKTIAVWDKKNAGLNGAGGMAEQWEAIIIAGNVKYSKFGGNVFNISREQKKEAKVHIHIKSRLNC